MKDSTQTGTQPTGTQPTGTQPRMDSIPTGTHPRLGLNLEWTQFPMGLNPTGTQPRQGLNFKFLSTSNGTISPSKYKILLFSLNINQGVPISKEWI